MPSNTHPIVDHQQLGVVSSFENVMTVFKLSFSALLKFFSELMKETMK